MKKFVSLLLVVVLAFGLLPLSAMAASETSTLQQLENSIKENSKAEIRDAEGNVLEVLDVNVQVQPLATRRSAEGTTYAITCTAKSKDYHSGSANSGGIMASATLVCTDVFGTENILHQVYGRWSGSASETRYRNVTYASYDTWDNEIDSAMYINVDQSFGYEPTDFIGYSFRVFTYAQVISSGETLCLTVSTDPNG